MGESRLNNDRATVQLSLRILAAALACAVAGAAHSADAVEGSSEAESSAVGENSGSLEEVIVTARRRSEDLQKVPISIASLSGDDLKIRGIDNVEQLDHTIPNFSPAPYNFFGTEQASFRMRGLPSVGVYVDGIAYQEEFGFFSDLVEMDRVEVLRGPQGTLFGKNSMGGAIQFITKEPADEFGARVSTTVGDYHRFNVSAAMDLPLSSTLLTKLTVAKVTRDGYLPSISVNQEFGSQDNLLARLDVLWKPTDAFNARFIIEENDLGTNGNPTTDWGLSPSCAGYPTAPNLTCLYNGASQYGAPLKVNQAWVYGASNTWLTAGNYDGPELNTYATNYKLILNYKLNDTWALKLLGSARDVRSESFEDFTNIPYHMFEGENTNNIHEATGEGQLLFSSDRLTGTTGVYYYNDFRRWRRENWFGNDVDLAVSPANNAAAKDFLGIPSFVPVPAFIPNIDVLFFYHIHGIAGFSEWTYKITDKLSLTAGVRYNRDTAEVQGFAPDQPIPALCCVPSTSITPNGAGPVYGVSNGVYTDTAPRISLQYQWTPAIMTYATFAEGFSAGGGTQTPTGVQSYAPEKLKNYEFGLRSDWFDHTLRFNTSLFYSLYSNVQANENEGFDNVTINAGKGTVKGAEVEGQWIITRAFSMNYGLGFLKTGYSDYPADSGILAGSPFPYAPKETVDVGAQYDTPLPGGGAVTLRLDEGWTSWVVTGSDSSGVYIPSYGLLGARLVYHPPNTKKWDVQLYGSNLLDKYYRLTGYAIPALGLNTGTVGLPRMFGLTVNGRFE
jgi:iron complex outermembrane receptor protein